MSVVERGAPPRARGARPAIVDCDVHNCLPNRDALKPYLDKRWYPYYEQGSHIGSHAGQIVGARPQRDIYRRDSMPASGPPGSDYELLREQLLEEHNVSVAILSPLEVLYLPTYGELSGALMRAMNDWMVEQWLDRDDRLRGAISISVEDEPRAAAEIERVAADGRFVIVLMTMVTREGYGHPKYWPIYEAAAEHGLPVAAHVGGFSGTHLATGWPTYFVEQHSGYTQPYQAQVTSLVYSGVFERFPNLQFVLEEGGLAWMPPLLWRLDRAWNSMRERAPHLERPPSEVIREHFWFTTQPFDEPERPEQILELLEQLDMNERIMFATDYPHWDFDNPDRILPASLIGAELREQIFARNAERCFQLASA